MEILCILIDVLNTVDFIDTTDGSVVFRTCDKEKDRVVLQIGTCDPERALKAAKLVEKDVAGIDINMGCPKEFSVKGGMGAALLKQRDKAQGILTKLVNGLEIPVSCKIRVFETAEDTVEFGKAMEATGISAIAVHGRTRDERPQHDNHNDRIRAVAKALTIPVIANGGSKEIEKYTDLERFRKDCNASSVMVARAAEWDCSIFRKEGRLPIDTVISSYLRYAVDYDNADGNTKYCVQNMLRDRQDSEFGRTFHETQTNEQICALWNIADYCRQKERDLRERGLIGRREMQALGPKKRKLDDDIVQVPCIFQRNLYADDTDLPKARLLLWTRRKRLGQPVYDTIQFERQFQSIVTVDRKKYSSSCWEKNKRSAEHSAALACLCSFGLVDTHSLKNNGSIIY
ncbi:tRNA-dihydrouridine(20) synthase [NAD(P)+]-like isoform X2 [Macrosteles quadrilineatus]|uniref:tRNA-dihydrouridine(20) synthase [NAD(P)+]-like isoform X2 n=1 Tax=Macrosteles quadrilineatus TaxID=74068 RepID=UPI0023E24735|nr:tRNA-dihydrouridine(20) synthase [NAD(P)+]-like isoform X2 [Macrosteles quadrilineatus]XP_054290857.1 tRNA-dihydrouridine(20) synthase [NAD(P)+]-like isoform X2 [Macrosteles quadrilineatus]